MVIQINKWTILTAIVILVLGIGGISTWLILRNTAETQIRKTMKQICWVVSKNPKESLANHAIKLQQSNEIFTDPCSLDFHLHLFQGEFPVCEIAAVISQYRMMFENVKAEIRDLHITINSPELANVSFTGQIHGTLKNGERINEVRDLVCELNKIDGKWQIHTMNIREVLEK